MMQFTTRAYNKIKLNEDNTITKTSDTDRFCDEINYYCNIPSKFCSYFPTIINYQNKNKPYSLQMKYYDSIDLGKLMCQTSFDAGKWNAIFKQLNVILKEFQSVSGKNDDVFNFYDSIYIQKTNTEYENLLKNSIFKDLSTYSNISINGKNYLNYHIIKNDIEQIIKKLIYSKFEYTMIHGDFCFGNILLLKDEKLLLVDPRGSWGAQGIYGDPRYDVAKLYHSFDGCYEYIVNDYFLLNCDKNVINFSYDNDNHNKIKEMFFSLFSNNIEYKLIEGLIYIGMCARHYDNSKRQIVMYATGIKLLNEVLETL